MPEPVHVHSYGVKNAARPPAVDKAIDCRGLANPHNIPRLRDLTGRDEAVRDYVIYSTGAETLVAAGRKAAEPGVHIAFFCYGGRHRSVAIAERLAKVLRADGVDVALKHWALGD